MMHSRICGKTKSFKLSKIKEQESNSHEQKDDGDSSYLLINGYMPQLIKIYEDLLYSQLVAPPPPPSPKVRRRA